MQIQCFEVGPLPTNCYFLTDEATGKTAVIDPGAYDNEVRQAAAKHDVAFILLTHAHFDHIMGVGGPGRPDRGQSLSRRRRR